MRECVKKDRNMVAQGKDLLFFLCSLFFDTRLTVCYQKLLEEQEERDSTTSAYLHACNKWVSAPSSSVRAVLARMYTYIFTRVLTFFEDAVTKTSNHHFSLSLSHNDILTLASLFSFNCSLLAALTSYAFKESAAARGIKNFIKNIRLHQRS